MNTPPQPHFPLFLLGAAIVLITAIGVTGWFYVEQQQIDLRLNIQKQLTAIADLKVQQIVNWRKERLSDAQFFFKAAFVARDVQAFLNEPTSESARNEIFDWLNLLKGGDRYAQVTLFDPQGEARIAVPDWQVKPLAFAREEIANALSARDVIMTELHREPDGDRDIHFSILFPILPPHTFSSHSPVDPLGVILLRLDPYQFLYPLIQTWPTPSRTAETLLVRQDGDEIVFLNELRHRSNTALSLRLPLNPSWPLPAAMAIQGQEGIVEGRDYRQVPVLAALRAIPDTSWFLIAKVDQEEIYGLLKKQATTTGMIVAMLMLTASLGVSLIWRHRDSRWLQRQLVIERQRQMLAERVEHLLKNANDIILLTDAKGCILEANDRALESYGYSLEEMQQMDIVNLRTPEARSGCAPYLTQLLNEKRALLETEHVRRDGSTFPVEISSCVVEIGGVNYLLGILRDITQRKAHEREIERLTRLYAALSQVNQAVVRATHHQDLCDEVCRVLVEFGGFRMAWIGQLDPETHAIAVIAQCGDESDYLSDIRICADDCPEGRGPTGVAIRENRPYICNDLMCDPRTLPWREKMMEQGFHASAAFPIHLDDRVWGALNIYLAESGFFGEREIALLEEAVTDIAFGLEHLQQAKSVQHLAYYDALTDLPNRAFLRERSAQALATAHRKGTEVALLFLDLDHFKNINDSLGHSVGDQLLRAVSMRLKNAVRETDVVSRLGGDEFLVILTETSLEGATQVARKIQEIFERSFEWNSRILHLSTSIGISLYPRDASDFESLLRYADAALYRAKESGRNTFHFFHPEMNAAAQERLVLEEALRQARSRDELELYYQPQVALDSGQLIGLEALLRWRHPERGLISPAKFIPVAESSGLIVEIGAWVLCEACRQNQVWREAGLFRVPIAVNLSAVQIRHGNLLAIIQQILAETGLPATELELEVTESLLVDHNQTVLDLFRDLKHLGVKFSIDDFGTGYSSLAYLKRFPVDKLKIDQSFIRDITNDSDDLAIARTVVSIGHSLRLKVIAEGVENLETVCLLQKMRCNEAQGYFFAKPMPAAEIPQWLTSRSLNR
ncbi:MAG: EAL domain-containing protein [Candidatus Competibacteraceae bacterium]|nr:EAL domain-containing protein [Candidatus Competibacteraceae bacterium]